ncbi:MAG TPA: hypothetical protein VFC19_38165 [Candidatus Limnocylindrales bacterium]|nr:hypothetical protein [Candidatus Limnocylindrales bacterium]
MPSGRAALALLVSLSLALSACESPAKEPSAKDLTVRPQWRELSLPKPPGPDGRLVLRDAVPCDGIWYVVGAVANAAGDTRPAIWRSDDGQAWLPVKLIPHSFYGELNVLYSAACKGRRLAALGSKPGGAHGNPRVSTWQQLPDGSFDEVMTAAFEVYGGPQAINVGRMAAGPAGFMMAGNRYSGAAVWFSPDSAEFKILERVPELASDSRGETWANDVAVTPQGWVVVGGILTDGRIDRDPMGWVSSDGVAWRRTKASSTDVYEEFQRVVVRDGKVFAVGIDGQGFAAWRLDGDQWTRTATFGAINGLGATRASTVVDGKLLCVISDGSAHHLFLSADGVSWRAVQGPSEMPSTADALTYAAAFAQRLVLLIDDGRVGRLWVADVSVTF